MRPRWCGRQYFDLVPKKLLVVINSMEKKSILTYSPSDVVDVSWAIFPHYLSSCLIVACRPSHPSVIVAVVLCCCRQYFKYLKNVLVIRERMEPKKHTRHHTSWAYFPRHTVPSVLELVLNKNALVIIEMK